MINFEDDTETCLWIITASILFLIILFIVGCCLCCRRKRLRKLKQTAPPPLDMTSLETPPHTPHSVIILPFPDTNRPPERSVRAHSSFSSLHLDFTIDTNWEARAESLRSLRTGDGDSIRPVDDPEYPPGPPPYHEVVKKDESSG